MDRSKAYVVIAKAGVGRGRHYDGRIARADSSYFLPYRTVFGPASFSSCVIWRATYCDPTYEWRGADTRVVYLDAAMGGLDKAGQSDQVSLIEETIAAPASRT